MATYRLRPSSAHRWVQCPGSVRLSEGTLPDDDQDNTVREEGTACHWLAHQLLTGKQVAEGTTAPNGVQVDADMFDAVEMYRAAIAEWPEPHFEEFVNCAPIHPECAGTPDVWSWDASSKTLRIGDLKYGFRFVAAEDNWQLLCYAAGVVRTFGIAPDRIELMICQPRGGGVRTHTITVDQAMAAWATLCKTARAALSETPECRTGNHCGQCEGRHKCVALQTASLGVLDATHAATPDYLPFAAAENELRMLKWAADIVTSRITGLEQQVVHEMRNGQPSRHWEMRSTPGRLAWKPESIPVVLDLAKLAGIEVVKPGQIVTPTQAKKLLGESLVNAHATRPAGALKLVPTDAGRWARIFGDK